jgi:hypothetical protein
MECLIVFGDDHHAGSIFVQSVYDPWSQDAIDAGEIVTMIKQGVDQRTGGISISRMNDHARRLIDHDDRWILIKDREGEGFCFEGKRFRLGKGSGNSVRGSYVSTGLGGFPVEQDKMFLNQILCLRAGEVEVGLR